jgi:hypothetical protein
MLDMPQDIVNTREISARIFCYFTVKLQLILQPCTADLSKSRYSPQNLHNVSLKRPQYKYLDVLICLLTQASWWNVRIKQYISRLSLISDYENGRRWRNTLFAYCRSIAYTGCFTTLGHNCRR